MSGGLPKARSAFHKIPDARIAIIASMWHPEAVEKMIGAAVAELHTAAVKPDHLKVHRMPGSNELPYAARVLFESDPKLDAILAFGVVLKGQTTHDANVLQHVVHGFGMVSDRFGKPIINEVIGVSELQHAFDRAGTDDRNIGVHAAFAVTELLAWRDSVKSKGNSRPIGI